MFCRDGVLSGTKILIVDDAPDDLAVTKLTLIHCHAEVVAAGSALEGLEQLLVHRPDVIVSDIGMPQMDGYQFMREVRNLPAQKGGQTPAIALTGFNLGDDRIKALNAGFQKHLSKPFQLQELIDAVASVVEPASR